MTYFATCFGLNLGGIRFRIRIDLDDAPEMYAPEQHVHVSEPAARSRAAASN